MKNKKLARIFSTLILTITLVLNFSLIANAIDCSVLEDKDSCLSVVVCNWDGTNCSNGINTGLSNSLRGTKDVANNSGLATDASVPEMVGNVIRIILGISGTAALIIVVMGGVKWMTSGGAEAKITSARKLMVSGAVGIVIIAAAYAITSFVMNQMLAVVN